MKTVKYSNVILNFLNFTIMSKFTTIEIASWERIYRANFINSLTGFKSANLIGTTNKSGQNNLGIFSSIIHIGSNPPLVGYINRPIKAAQNTLNNIKATGVYTLNHIQCSFIEQAHQTSAKYEETVSEFEEVGLTPQFLNNITAPFVKESRVKYALSLKQIIPIALNDTFLVIGEIISIEIEDSLITDDGFIQLDKAGSISCNGLDAYYKNELISRYQYAQPGMKPKKV